MIGAPARQLLPGQHSMRVLDLSTPAQAQLDRFAAMADALAKGDGPAQGLAEDFFISATWLQ